MSNHIGSRWYRAPEICLLEKQYDSASDVWSLGCTMAELVRGITFSKNNDANAKFGLRQLALFPGDSCYPISPKYKDPAQRDVVSPCDQLILILKELKDHIEEADFSFIADEDPRKYAEHLTKDVKVKCAGNYGRGTLTRLKGMDKRILESVQSMIEFNPYFRTSATETLYLPIFDAIRNKTVEKPAPSKVALAVDEDAAFDYEACKTDKYTRADYMGMIWKEAKETHQQRMRFLKEYLKEKEMRETVLLEQGLANMFIKQNEYKS